MRIKERKPLRGIALRRNGIMSLMRPAAGGESCFAGFFLIFGAVVERSKNMGKERMKLEKQTLTIRVPEELDHYSADAICRKADQLVQTRDVREIVFDFSETEFCDSSGIGMLMGRYKMMQALGGSVRAVRVRERTARILLLSGVMKLIPVETLQGGAKQ